MSSNPTDNNPTPGVGSGLPDPMESVIAKLRERAANGERLRADELRLLQESLAPGPKKDAGSATIARSKTKLAEALGISRPTLDKLFALPGRPKPRTDNKFYIPDWKEFAENRLPKFNGGTAALQANPEETIGNIKVKIAKLELREKEDEYERKRGKFITVSRAGEEVIACMELVKREFYKRFRQFAPLEYEAVGGDANECRRINERHLEEAFSFLHKGEWTIDEAIEACQKETA